VFSDETPGGIEHADPRIYAAMEREFARWDDIDVHYRDEVITSGGHGFAAISRRRLLHILRERCAELGVRMYFRTEAPDPATLSAGHGLTVAADGANSATRAGVGGGAPARRFTPGDADFGPPSWDRMLARTPISTSRHSLCSSNRMFTRIPSAQQYK